MTVDLIAYTQRVVPTSDKNPLDIVEEAASICYDSSMTDDYKIAKGCKASGHYSVLEHINFTFYVKDVSRALLAQISRHRHISMSCRSQRYCSEDGFKYVNPFTGEDADVFDNMMSDIDTDYQILKKYQGNFYDPRLNCWVNDCVYRPDDSFKEKLAKAESMCTIETAVVPDCADEVKF